MCMLNLKVCIFLFPSVASYKKSRFESYVHISTGVSVTLRMSLVEALCASICFGVNKKWCFVRGVAFLSLILAYVTTALCETQQINGVRL